MSKIMQIIIRVLVVVLMVFSGMKIWGADTNGNNVEDSYEPQLAGKFAPIVHYHEDNPLFPVNVTDIYSEDYWNGQDQYKALPIASHSPMEWADYYNSTVQYLAPTLYYNIFTQTWKGYGGSNFTYYVLQYWFYYPFNDAGNLHEGDWEHVALVLDNQDPSLAQIVGAIFHQHYNLISVDKERLEITSDDIGEHLNVYVGGKTILHVFGLGNLVRDDCFVGGFGEVTGASFPWAGYHSNTWKMDGPIMIEMDEQITVGRTLDYAEYTLINLRGTGDDLWWLGSNAYFGVPGLAIWEDTPVCEFPIVGGNINYPKTGDPPKDPTQPIPDVGTLWDSYPIKSSLETEKFVANSADVEWPGVRVSLLADAQVSVKVYDTAEPPHLIKTLVDNEVWDAGIHDVIWHDEDDIEGSDIMIFVVEASPGNILTVAWYRWIRFNDETFRNVYNETDAGGTLTLKQGIRTIKNSMPSGTQERIFNAVRYNVWTDDPVFEDWQNTSDTIQHNNWNDEPTQYRVLKSWKESWYALPQDHEAVFKKLVRVHFASDFNIQLELQDPRWLNLETGEQTGNVFVPVNGSYKVFLDQNEFFNDTDPIYCLRAPHIGQVTDSDIYFFDYWESHRQIPQFLMRKALRPPPDVKPMWSSNSSMLR